MSKNKLNVVFGVLYTLVVAIVLLLFFVLELNKQFTVMNRQVADLTQEIVQIKSSTTNLHKKLILVEGLMYTVQTNAKVTITHYSADRFQTDSTPTVTAFMVQVKIGYVAVSRDLFNRGWTPGRKVYIKGKGVYIIADLMNKRKGNWIDIYTNSKTAAKKAGIERGVMATLFMEKVF